MLDWCICGGFAWADDGLFLPYMDEWPNLGPINGGLKQYNVTYEKMESYYLSIQEAGFHSLSYFDIGTCRQQYAFTRMVATFRTD